MASTSQHLAEFAEIGLRTLVLASKDVAEGVYSEWSNSYKVHSDM